MRYLVFGSDILYITMWISSFLGTNRPRDLWKSEKGQIRILKYFFIYFFLNEKPCNFYFNW